MWIYYMNSCLKKIGLEEKDKKKIWTRVTFTRKSVKSTACIHVSCIDIAELKNRKGITFHIFQIYASNQAPYECYMGNVRKLYIYLSLPSRFDITLLLELVVYRILLLWWHHALVLTFRRDTYKGRHCMCLLNNAAASGK